MLPLLLLLRHKRSKPRVLSYVVQLSVTLKKRIIREALLGGDLQPFHRLLGLIHKSVSGSDVIRRVMEVSVTTANLDRVLDGGFRFALLTSFGQHHGLHTGNHPTLIF